MKKHFTGNGTGDHFEFSGGVATIPPRGAFGGGTLLTQYCPSFSDPTVDANFKTILSQTDSDGDTNVTVGAGFIRFVLSGATSPDLEVDALGAMGRVSNWA